MIPEHDGDSWLKYQQQVPVVRPGLNPRTLVRNVHHDRANGKEGRVLTVLVYLNQLKHGGHTIFPCIGAQGGPPADTELCRTFVDAYDTGSRMLTGGGPSGWNSTGTNHTVLLACSILLSLLYCQTISFTSTTL